MSKETTSGAQAVPPEYLNINETGPTWDNYPNPFTEQNPQNLLIPNYQGGYVETEIDADIMESAQQQTLPAEQTGFGEPRSLFIPSPEIPSGNPLIDAMNFYQYSDHHAGLLRDGVINNIESTPHVPRENRAAKVSKHRSKGTYGVALLDDYREGSQVHNFVIRSGNVADDEETSSSEGEDTTSGIGEAFVNPRTKHLDNSYVEPIDLSNSAKVPQAPTQAQLIHQRTKNFIARGTGLGNGNNQVVPPNAHYNVTNREKVYYNTNKGPGAIRKKYVAKCGDNMQYSSRDSAQMNAGGLANVVNHQDTQREVPYSSYNSGGPFNVPRKQNPSQSNQNTRASGNSNKAGQNEINRNTSSHSCNTGPRNQNYQKFNSGNPDLRDTFSKINLNNTYSKGTKKPTRSTCSSVYGTKQTYYKEGAGHKHFDGEHKRSKHRSSVSYDDWREPQTPKPRNSSVRFDTLPQPRDYEYEEEEEQYARSGVSEGFESDESYGSQTESESEYITPRNSTGRHGHSSEFSNQNSRSGRSNRSGGRHARSDLTYTRSIQSRGERVRSDRMYSKSTRDRGERVRGSRRSEIDNSHGYSGSGGVGEAECTILYRHGVAEGDLTRYGEMNLSAVDVKQIPCLTGNQIFVSNPETSLPKFSGNIIEFAEWKSEFVSMLGRIEPSQRLRCLKQSLDADTVLLLAGFGGTREQTFRDAFRRLDERFDRPNQVRQVLMSNLMEIIHGYRKEDSSKFPRMIHRLREKYDRLMSLNPMYVLQLDAAVYDLTDKLPDYFGRKIKRSRQEDPDNYTFTKVLQKCEKEASIMEGEEELSRIKNSSYHDRKRINHMSLGEDHSRYSQRMGDQFSDEGEVDVSVEAGINALAKRQFYDCNFCGTNDHTTLTCTRQFTNETKAKLIKERRICLVCGSTGHWGRVCNIVKVYGRRAEGLCGDQECGTEVHMKQFCDHVRFMRSD